MKINHINAYQHKNRTFGMAVQMTSDAIKFIENNLDAKDMVKFSELIESQKNNPIDIRLYFSEMFHLANPIVIREGILAEVKDKKFYSCDYESVIPIFKKNPIIKLLKAASKYADKKALIAKTLKIPM